MQYNVDQSRITSKLGTFTSVKRHYKVHTAYLCMGASIKDIYINGIVHSYVCVSRRQIKSKRAIFSRMRERANIVTNGIRVRFKPTNKKMHKAKHAGYKPTNTVQITTFY